MNFQRQQYKQVVFKRIITYFCFAVEFVTSQTLVVEFQGTAVFIGIL